LAKRHLKVGRLPLNVACDLSGLFLGSRQHD
jgi:hypothetical protein